jgi:hypothetical protein
MENTLCEISFLALPDSRWRNVFKVACWVFGTYSYVERGKDWTHQTGEPK